MGNSQPVQKQSEQLQQKQPPSAKQTVQQNSPENTNCVFHPELYQGRWYEIARYNNWFEKECEQSIQDLKWDSEKRVMKIKNTCVRKDGSEFSMRGVGTPNQNHACQLTVRFEGIPIPGQYWVLWTDYDKWAMVGNQNKTSFWILAREPYISRDDYRLLRVYAQVAGYNDQLIVPRNAIVGYKIEKGHQHDQSEEPSCTDFNSDL